jgi:hypothetical protein
LVCDPTGNHLLVAAFQERSRARNAPAASILSLKSTTVDA